MFASHTTRVTDTDLVGRSFHRGTYETTLTRITVATFNWSAPRTRVVNDMADLAHLHE